MTKARQQHRLTRLHMLEVLYAAQRLVSLCKHSKPAPIYLCLVTSAPCCPTETCAHPVMSRCHDTTNNEQVDGQGGRKKSREAQHCLQMFRHATGPDMTFVVVVVVFSCAVSSIKTANRVSPQAARGSPSALRTQMTRAEPSGCMHCCGCGAETITESNKDCQ